MAYSPTETERAAPDFLYIGAPRCASTWLDRLLRSHPRVYVPRDKKEIRYFSHHYDRGEAWYRSFFPPENKASAYTTIGELSPQYLFPTEAPEWIASLGTVRRFLLSLRNPVERLLSHYKFNRRIPGRVGTLDEFIADAPEGVPWSRYGGGLTRFVERFGAESMLVLIYERMFDDPEDTARRIAAHLGVSPDGFSPEALHGRVNQALAPRFPRLYRAVRGVGQSLYGAGLFPTPAVARRLKLRRFFVNRPPEAVSLTPERRAQLLDLFEPDIAAVEEFLGSPLPEWRR